MRRSRLQGVSLTQCNMWLCGCVLVCFSLLWVFELVHQRHFLHQVSSDGAHQVVEVVLCEAVFALRQPEGDVVVERRVFTEQLRRRRRHTE